MHILSGKSKCIGGSASRERERDARVCVLFEFRHFILTLRTCLRYLKVSRRYLQKILIVRDVLYYNINWTSAFEEP